MTHERSDRRASTEARLALALALLSALLGASSLVVAPLNGASLLEFINGPAQSATLAVAFSVLGASILGHRSQPRIGWICCTIGLTDALAAASDQYARYALATEPGLPGGALASWLRAWTWAPAIGLLLTFLVLLFPDGRLPSQRWQPVAWSAAVSMTALAVLFAAHAWPLRGRSLLAPFSLPELTGPAGVVAALVLLASAVASALSLVVRLRRATGIERQQLKWFTCAAVVGVIAGSLPADVPVLVALLGLMASLCLPGAIAIAIRRYRLYDIDRILNRTLVYGLLSAILGLSYAGVVLLLGQLAGGVTGDPPSWAVAGATLAVAALFQPARRRIQQAVDRRFNRRKYNTAKTIEAFSTRLREQIDLDTLSTEVLAVVDQTMEPTRVSLWLRSSPHGSSGTPHNEARPTTWAY
jgi:hypothetical protein